MAIEVVMGTVMRRQSGIMDMVRDVRDNQTRLEKMITSIARTMAGLTQLEKRIERTIGQHDSWERKRVGE